MNVGGTPNLSEHDRTFLRGLREKVVLLGRFDSVGSLEIADPYSGTSEDFRFCFQQVNRCCDVLAARLGVKSSEPAMSQVLPVNPENS